MPLTVLAPKAAPDKVAQEGAGREERAEGGPHPVALLQTGPYLRLADLVHL